MTLDTATLAVIITAVFGGGSLSVAVLQSFVNRGSRRADITEKVAEATDKIFTRYDKDLARLEEKAEKCETRLGVTERQLQDAHDETRRVKTAFRIYMEAVESGDQMVLATATEAAKQLLI